MKNNTVAFSKKLDWGEICGPNFIVLSDHLSFSSNQIIEHKLHKKFIVPDYHESPVFYGYFTKILCK